MTIYGERPRPRVLIQGFDDQTATRLESIFPTSKRVKYLHEVRQAEWDLLVTDQGFLGADPHLYGLGLGGALEFGYLWMNRDRARVRFEFEFSKTSLATHFEIPADLDGSVADLVRRLLLPLIQGNRENSVLTPRRIASSPVSEEPDGSFRPFLLTTEPAVLAAAIRRETGAEVWCLPPSVTDPFPWARAALSLWHRQDSTRFPIDPLWRDNSEWLTVEEDELRAALGKLAHDREQAMDDFAKREEEFRAQLQTAAQKADDGLRRLLTAKGDDLVQAVQEVLKDLFGFDVSNRDEVNPPNDRREDLWVTNPKQNTDWIALVEVRGYTGGASQGDLLRLAGRFAKRHMQEFQKTPTRLWYLVNQFAGSDPSSRPPVLESNPDELEAFQEESGLAMDTAHLFSLAKQVQLGSLSAKELRERLMSATGRWT